jgi:3-oxoadipate enol-lactonase
VAEVDAGGCRIWYSVSGRDDGEALLLSNSLGTDAELWTPQLPELARAFRVVRYDTRGHGRSQAPPGSYTLERLGQDALAVLDAAGVARAHVCGISLGGLTAMWLALFAAPRVGRIVLANTNARVGTHESWDQRIALVREQGMAAVAAATMERWFTAGFRQREPGACERIRAMVAACPPEGYVGCCGALRTADLREQVGGIAAPALVVTGVHDPVTSPAAAAELAARIPHARLVTLPAAHLSNVEEAAAFTSAVLVFLT